MEKKEKIIAQAFVFAIGAIICCIIMVGGFLYYKKNAQNTIVATGSYEVNFESDLIVWRGSFKAKRDTAMRAYEKIKQDKEVVQKYLNDNGVNNTEVVFSSIDISELYNSIYDENGNYKGTEQTGYQLSQDITITSNDIAKIESVSRDISTLLEQDVEFLSYKPEYYCTTLSDIKLDLIDKATENAKTRIDIMAKQTGASITKLKSSKLGIFQITARNTGTASYGSDGYIDTSSKSKTATITVRLEYAIE
ncbi:MAG: SIMPL domain-containing protein [Eubacteriales bacterium]|nr:SIMPL domain-containing protein [Eubacteriales bacterium]